MYATRRFALERIFDVQVLIGRQNLDIVSARGKKKKVCTRPGCEGRVPGRDRMSRVRHPKIRARANLRCLGFDKDVKTWTTSLLVGKRKRCAPGLS